MKWWWSSRKFSQTSLNAVHGVSAEISTLEFQMLFSFSVRGMHAHMYAQTKYICQILQYIFNWWEVACLSEEFFGEFWNEVKSTKMKWACLILEHYSFIPMLFNLIYVISFLWNKYVEMSYLECLSKLHFESMLDKILMNKWMGLLHFVWKHFEIYKIHKFCLNF